MHELCKSLGMSMIIGANILTGMKKTKTEKAKKESRKFLHTTLHNNNYMSRITADICQQRTYTYTQLQQFCLKHSNTWKDEQAANATNTKKLITRNTRLEDL